MSVRQSDIDYAIWTDRETSISVTYSLALFHDIDFQVNEGYRRIPHGGIEVGGLLFGSSDGQSIRLESFRPIECEHVFGPSFVLSDNDLEVLEQQLTDAASDPELAGLNAVGWFVAHTRSPLSATSRELEISNRLFPKPGNLLLLVKPERFQPTRFGFLVRDANGDLPQDASNSAVILPLSGKAARTGTGPIPSIPAPDRKPEPPAAASDERAVPPAPVPVPAKEPPVPVLTKEPPQLAAGPVPLILNPPPSATAPGGGGSNFWRQKSESESKNPVIQIDPRETIKHPEAQPLSPGTSPGSPRPPVVEEIRARPAETLRSAAPPPTDFERPPSNRVASEKSTSSARLIFVLALSALLGCTVGYVAYLQLPSATIALKVYPQPSALLVSWPPEQTRNAVYSAIRVNDGQPLTLTNEEKSAGEAEVQSTGDNVKIELISRHWMRDSRGIIRYVRPEAPLEVVAPKSQ